MTSLSEFYKGLKWVMSHPSVTRKQEQLPVMVRIVDPEETDSFGALRAYEVPIEDTLTAWSDRITITIRGSLGVHYPDGTVQVVRFENKER